MASSMIVVPLYKKVLLPGVVIKLILRGKEATQLVRRHFRTQSHDRNKVLQIACIPSSKVPAADEANSGILVPKSIRDHLYQHGCSGRILRVQRLANETYGVFVEGVSRFRVKLYHHDAKETDVNMTTCNVVHYDDEQQKSSNNKADTEFRKLLCAFVDKMRALDIPGDLLQQMVGWMDNKSEAVIADMLVCMIDTSFEEKLQMLTTESIPDRMQLAHTWMTRQLHVLQISEQIHSTVEAKMSRQQREFYLRQQLEAIQRELKPKRNASAHQGNEAALDEDEDEEEDMAQLRRRLVEAQLPTEVLQVVQRELVRLQRLQPASAEWAVARNYLELIADLPWSKKTNEVLDIAAARKQLDGDHFGLDQVKKRIIEYLSVAKVKGDLKSPILCFVGPPGVGKTSLGRSIAAALNRKFYRASLGGVRDEADMRGHRRTYVAAMPGLIIQGIRRCGVNNPVYLLDEIDKLVHSKVHGDPAGALLEILDPEQNHTFSDHYLNVPFDLSSVLFIATANSLDTIPEPLLDRMEVIRLHGYSFDEKLHITKSHLLPKQIKSHGLHHQQIQLSDELLMWIAEHYTRESGVRSLERAVAGVIRGKCVELADLRDSDMECAYDPYITKVNIERALGLPLYDASDESKRDMMPGVVTGISDQGPIVVEAILMPGKGNLCLTGSLGSVIKESAQLALTWIRSNSHILKINQLQHRLDHDIHIHVPQGAVPKDGPSAGLAILCALVSLYTNYNIQPTTAFIGEISLRGQVLPVRHTKDRILAAHRAGLRKVILPFANRKNVMHQVPENIRDDLGLVYVKTVWDALHAAVPKQEYRPPLESHL